MKKGQLLSSPPDTFRKAFDIPSPVSGQVQPLNSIDGTLYTQGYFGPGAIINAPSSIIKAPFDGVCSRVTPLDYAIEIKSSVGLKCLIKFGESTQHLHGAQFNCHVKRGSTFKAGAVLFTVNTGWLKQQGVNNVCIMTLLNANALLGVMPTTRKYVEAVEDPLLTLFV